MIPDDPAIFAIADSIKSQYEAKKNWENLEFRCRTNLNGREVIVFGGQEIESSHLLPLIKRLTTIFQKEMKTIKDLFSRLNNTELKNVEVYTHGVLVLSLHLGIDDVAQQILNSGKKIDFDKKSTVSIFTPLMCAISERNFPMVESLIKHGANPFSALYEHQGILSSGDFEKLKAFVDSLPDINQQNADGETLLHHAVLYPSLSLADLLLERGAKNDIPNNEGQTPLDIIPEWNHAMRNFLLKEQGENS